MDICATSASSAAAAAASNPAIARNWLNLDIFSMKKFLDDVIGPLRVPSHRRYLHYFAGLLSGHIKMNAAPLYLRYVSVDAPPTWLNYDVRAHSNGSNGNGTMNGHAAEWRTFVKVYEGLRCVFTSDIHVVPLSTRQFVFEVADALRLRGDVIVRCYHIVPSVRVYQERRELILSAQFHTCAITGGTITFGRSELDYACDGECEEMESDAFWVFGEAFYISMVFSNALQIHAFPTTTRSRCTLRSPASRATSVTFCSKVRSSRSSPSPRLPSTTVWRILTMVSCGNDDSEICCAIQLTRKIEK